MSIKCKIAAACICVAVSSGAYAEKCDKVHQNARFIRAFTTQASDNKWFVRCFYGPTFYNALSDLPDRPRLDGEWKLVTTGDHSEYQCSRSHSNCEFYKN